MCCFSPEELVALIILAALAFDEEFSTDDLNVLGNWVVAVGSIMLTVAAQRQLLASACKEGQDTQQQIKELENRVKALESSIAATIKKGSER